MPKLDNFDTDGDGNLDETELREAYYSGQAKNFKELFTACDEDGSGHLDRQEMDRFFRLIGKSHSDTRKMFRDTDTNGDGMISYSEFNDWLKKEVIEQTFDVKHCEQTIGNASREMEGKTAQHLKVVAKVEADKKEIARLTANALPYQQKRAALNVNLIAKQKQAAAMRKQLEMIDKQMHETAALMKKIKPGGKHVSGIALMQIGHQSQRTNSSGRVARHRSALQKSNSAGFSLMGSKSDSQILLASSRPVSAVRGQLKTVGIGQSIGLPKGMSQTTPVKSS